MPFARASSLVPVFVTINDRRALSPTTEARADIADEGGADEVTLTDDEGGDEDGRA